MKSHLLLTIATKKEMSPYRVQRLATKSMRQEAPYYLVKSLGPPIHGWFPFHQIGGAESALVANFCKQ
jgi:hypothetical protein